MRLFLSLALGLAARSFAAERAAPPENAAAGAPGSGWSCPKPDPARPRKPAHPVSDEAVKDYAVELGCMVDWLAGHRAESGAPGADVYEKQRRRARFLIAEINEWAKSARLSSAFTASGDDVERAKQRYLSGVVYYQKGDYDRALKEWKAAVLLDPANQDARAGVERIGKLYGKTAP